NLLIAGECGVEADLAHRLAGSTKPFALDHRAVGKDEYRRRPRLAPRSSLRHKDTPSITAPLKRVMHRAIWRFRKNARAGRRRPPRDNDASPCRTRTIGEGLKAVNHRAGRATGSQHSKNKCLSETNAQFASPVGGRYCSRLRRENKPCATRSPGHSGMH